MPERAFVDVSGGRHDASCLAIAHPEEIASKPGTRGPPRLVLDVLEHVYDPLRLLQEAARVSKQFVIVGVPNFSSLPARLQVLRGTVPENNQPNKGHLYWFNHNVLSKVATKAGLQVVEMQMNTFKPISLFGNWLVRLFPNLFALSFVVKYTK